MMDVLVVTAFEGGPDWLPEGRPADQVPFAAPFGPAFAAFEDQSGRQAWIERGGVADEILTGRLTAVLDDVRARGYTIERNTPSLAHAAQLMDGLHADEASEPIRDMVGALLVEITQLSFAPEGDSQGARGRPISSLAAPVFDDRGRVVCNLSLHPFLALPAKKVAELGRLLTATSASVTSAASPVASASR
jgi:DNA-binding IclR family transcriptional regulator